MNLDKLINKNIRRLRNFDELEDSDIYNRCSLIKFKDIENNSDQNDMIIEDIQGVLGFEEWESLIDRSNKLVSMLNRFMKFITNPRKISR